MTKRRTTKRFDCVEMKRKAQAAVYENIKHLNPEEELAFYLRTIAMGPLAAWWKKVNKT